MFYDIGSGTGKPAFAALLLHPFARVAGVEILEGLHARSEALRRRWEGGTAEEPTADQPVGLRDELADELCAATRAAAVRFVCGDATDLEGSLDWSDGDVVFANSTCFSDTLLRAVAGCAERLRVGAFFITFTKRLPSACFDVLEHHVYRMSWGAATVFIHRRNDNPADPGRYGGSVAVPAAEPAALPTAAAAAAAVASAAEGVE